MQTFFLFVGAEVIRSLFILALVIFLLITPFLLPLLQLPSPSLYSRLPYYPLFSHFIFSHPLFSHLHCSHLSFVTLTLVICSLVTFSLVTLSVVPSMQSPSLQLQSFCPFFLSKFPLAFHDIHSMASCHKIDLNSQICYSNAIWPCRTVMLGSNFQVCENFKNLYCLYFYLSFYQQPRYHIYCLY